MSISAPISSSTASQPGAPPPARPGGDEPGVDGLEPAGPGRRRPASRRTRTAPSAGSRHRPPTDPAICSCTPVVGGQGRHHGLEQRGQPGLLVDVEAVPGCVQRLVRDGLDHEAVQPRVRRCVDDDRVRVGTEAAVGTVGTHDRRGPRRHGTARRRRPRRGSPSASRRAAHGPRRTGGPRPASATTSADGGAAAGCTRPGTAEPTPSGRAGAPLVHHHVPAARTATTTDGQPGPAPTRRGGDDDRAAPGPTPATTRRRPTPGVRPVGERGRSSGGGIHPVTIGRRGPELERARHAACVDAIRRVSVSCVLDRCTRGERWHRGSTWQ